MVTPGGKEDEVLTEWVDAFPSHSQKSVEAETQARQPSISSKAPTQAVHTTSASSRLVPQQLFPPQEAAAAPASPYIGTADKSSANRTDARHSPASKSPPSRIVVASDKVDCAPLRKLLRDHKVYARNFVTLKQSTAVMASLERLGAEALARSGLLKALAAAFTRAEGGLPFSAAAAAPLAKPAAKPAAAAIAAEAATPSASQTPSSTQSVRLVLTHASADSSVRLADDAAAEVATLEVSQRVVDWLSRPIEVPPLTAGKWMAFAEEGLAQLEARKKALRTPRRTETLSESQERGAEVAIDEGLRLWYEQWGQQQLQRRWDQNSVSDDVSSSRSVDSSMSQWYGCHVALSEVLLSRFRDVKRSLSLHGRKQQRTTEDASGVAHETDWRLLPRSPISFDPHNWLRAKERKEDPPTQPDQTVQEELLLLLEELHELLRTLMGFKWALEGARVMASGSGLGEDQRQPNDSVAVAHAAAKGSCRTTDALRPSATPRGSEEGGAAESVFVQLRHAVSRLQQLETAAATSFPTSDVLEDSSQPQRSPDDAVSAARAQVRKVGDQWLSLISRVDTLQELPDGDAAVHEQRRDPDSVLKVLSSSSTASTAVSVDSGFFHHTTAHTIPVLDLLISVVVRCLLFYVPALSYVVRRSVLGFLAVPFMAKEQSVLTALWTTHFAVASLLDTAAVRTRGNADETRAASAHLSLLVQTVVRTLRPLCGPSVFDHRTHVVQQLFQLPSRMSASAAHTTSTETTGNADTSRQHLGTSLASQSTPQASLQPVRPQTDTAVYKDVTQALRGSREHQRAGYELLLFFLVVVDQSNAFSSTSHALGNEHSIPHQHRQSKTSMEGDSFNSSNCVSPSSSSAPSPELRRLITMCFTLVNVDRFLTEQLYKVQRNGGLREHCFFPLALPPASQHSKSPQLHHLRPSCAQVFAQQVASAHGLARQTLCALHQPVLRVWPSLLPFKGQVLWDAVRYSVVAPAATVLFSTRDPASSDAAATDADVHLVSTSSITRIAETAEWRTSAPVLRDFSSGATPAVWKRMWVSLAAELASFPDQMKVVLQPPESAEVPADSGTHPHSSPSPVPPSVQASDAGRGDAGVTAALRACCTELGELALLSAWLLVAAEHAFTTTAGSDVSEAAAQSAMLRKCEDRVASAFTACVKGVLAVWTVTGTTADAGRQLLELFSCCRAPAWANGAKEDSAETPDAVLLWQMMKALRVHLWTTELEQLVRGWEAQTRFVQRPPVPSPDEAGVAGESMAGNQVKGGDDAVETSTPDASMRSLEGLEDADPCVRGWWRSLQAEEVGLPSVRVYLLDVFTALARITRTRGEGSSSLAACAAANECAEGTERVSLDRQEVQQRIEASEGEAGPTMQRGEHVNVSGTKGPAGMDTTLSTAAPVVLSFAELVVVLRVLASISMRGGVRAAHSFPGSSSTTTTTATTTTNAVVGGGNSGATATMGTAGRAGSVLEALHRVALHHAVLSAKEGAGSSAPSSAAASTKTTPAAAQALASVDASASSSSAAADPIAAANKAVDDIERALLGSLAAHAADLPAASLLEAMWLGLWPLSALSAAFQRACAMTDANDVFADGKPCASSLAMQPSLGVSSSVWLETLHADICTSAHTRLLCCFLLYRHYSVLCVGNNADGLNDETSDAAAEYGPADGLTCKTPSAARSDVSGPTPVTVLARLFAAIRGSCAEALKVGSHVAASASAAAAEKTSTQATNGGSDVGGRPGSFSAAAAAGVDKPDKADRGAPPAPFSERENGDAAAASQTTSEERERATAAALKEHARHFLMVFVLSSEIHQRLLPLETQCRNRLTTHGAVATLCSSLAKEEDAVKCRRVLEQLYASLLAALEAFVPHKERGCCTEVVQAVSIITWRIRDMGLLVLHGALPPLPNDPTNCARSGEQGASAAAASLATSLTSSHPCAHADLSLLCRYRAAVQALMPCVDAEVLVRSTETVPSLLKLAVVFSAKAAVEHAIRGIPTTAATHDCAETHEAQAEAESEATTPAAEGLRDTEGDDRVSKADFSFACSSGCAEEVNGTESAAAPPLRTPHVRSKPIWSLIPLENIFHRVASEQLLVRRHIDVLSAMAVLAPELAAALLPAASIMRSKISFHGLHPDETELALEGVAACATALHQQNQKEELRRDGVSLLSTAVGSSLARPAVDGARTRLDLLRSGAAQDVATPGRSEQPSPSSLSSSALRIGEVDMAGLSRSSIRACGKTQQQQQPTAVYRSVGALPTMRAAPPQLRQVWAAVARRLLESDDGGSAESCNNHNSDHSSLWLMALSCGGVVGVAETQLFEQLLACFVFNPVPVEQKDATAQQAHEGHNTRVARLSAAGWTLLIEACDTAVDHRYREGYRTLLREALVQFLSRLTIRRLVEGTARSNVLHSPDHLPSSAGSEICGLLESISKLFIEDSDFWEATVKRAVVRCGAELREAATKGEASTSATLGAVSAAATWAEQWQRSFNWAVRNAGHPSLTFPDVWTDTVQCTAAEVAVARMEQSLRELTQALPVKPATERVTEEDYVAPSHGRNCTYVPL